MTNLLITLAVLFYNAAILVGTTWLVWHGWSGWWYLLAIVLMASTSNNKSAD